MRIIAGKWGGMVLKQPTFAPTRPTTNIAKEALFNSLHNYFNFDNISFLDLFGGTGQISFEMASRGCTDITLVEKHDKCVQFIQKTADRLSIDGMQIVFGDVFSFIKQCETTYDLIFAGPPYPLENLADLPDLIIQQNMIEGKGWFILEHNPKHHFKAHPNFVKRKKYGQTIFSIFANEL